MTAGQTRSRPSGAAAAAAAGWRATKLAMTRPGPAWWLLLLVLGILARRRLSRRRPPRLAGLLLFGLRVRLQLGQLLLQRLPSGHQRLDPRDPALPSPSPARPPPRREVRSKKPSLQYSASICLPRASAAAISSSTLSRSTGSFDRRLRRRFCSSQLPRLAGSRRPPSLAAGARAGPSAPRCRRPGGRRRSFRRTRRSCRGNRAGPAASAPRSAWPARRRTSDRATRTPPCPGSRAAPATSASMASMSRWLVGSSSTSTLGRSAAQQGEDQPRRFAARQRADALVHVVAREQHPPQGVAHEGGGLAGIGGPQRLQRGVVRDRSASPGGPGGSSRPGPRGPSGSAGVGPQPVDHDLQQGRLAQAVGPDDGHPLASPHHQRHVGQHLLGAVGLADARRSPAPPCRWGGRARSAAPACAGCWGSAPPPRCARSA